MKRSTLFQGGGDHYPWHPRPGSPTTASVTLMRRHSQVCSDTLSVMCGRFTLTYRKAELLAAELGVPLESLGDYRPVTTSLPPSHTGSCVRATRTGRSSRPDGAWSTSG